jgi:hypothetical protein
MWAGFCTANERGGCTTFERGELATRVREPFLVRQRLCLYIVDPALGTPSQGRLVLALTLPLQQDPESRLELDQPPAARGRDGFGAA